MIERSIIGCNEFVPRNNLYPIIHLSISIHKILFKNFICTVSVCKYSELLFVSSLLRSCCLFTQSLIQSEDSGVNFTKLCIARFPKLFVCNSFEGSLTWNVIQTILSNPFTSSRSSIVVVLYG